MSLGSAKQAVDFALKEPSTGRLTIAQEVFDQARDLALHSLEPATPQSHRARPVVAGFACTWFARPHPRS